MCMSLFAGSLSLSGRSFYSFISLFPYAIILGSNSVSPIVPVISTILAFSTTMIGSCVFRTDGIKVIRNELKVFTEVRWTLPLVQLRGRNARGGVKRRFVRDQHSVELQL